MHASGVAYIGRRGASVHSVVFLGFAVTQAIFAQHLRPCSGHQDTHPRVRLGDLEAISSRFRRDVLKRKPLLFKAGHALQASQLPQGGHLPEAGQNRSSSLEPEPAAAGPGPGRFFLRIDSLDPLAGLKSLVQLVHGISDITRKKLLRLARLPAASLSSLASPSSSGLLPASALQRVESCRSRGQGNSNADPCDHDSEGENEGSERIPLLLKNIIAVFVVLCCILGIVLWQVKYEGRPFNLALALPGPAAALLPGSFHRVQDLEHLMLMLLFFAGLGTIAIMVFYIIRTKGIYCETAGLVFLVPCICTVYRCIGSYDDRLCSRRQAVEKKKREISQLYDTVLGEMEATLQRAAESNAGLAEQHFASKKRDFVRFVDWVSEQDLDPGGVYCFRRFIKRWLTIFEETSVDPLGAPRTGGPPTFLFILSCSESFKDVTLALKEVLKKEDVRFIAVERERLVQQRERYDRLTNGGVGRESSMEAAYGRARAKDGDRKPPWISAQDKAGFGFEAKGSDELFPFKLKGGCFTVTVWSQSHLALLLGFIVAPTLFVCYLVDCIRRRKHGEPTAHVAIEFGLLAITLSLVVILWHFERIDAVMRLEKEIAELDADMEKVVQQRVCISDFYGANQTLVEFWTDRTVPWLDLLKEIHERLREKFRESPDEAMLALAHACDAMEDIDRRLPSVAVWRDAQSRSMFGDGEAVGDKTFGAWVNKQVVPGDLNALADSMLLNIESLHVDFGVEAQVSHPVFTNSPLDESGPPGSSQSPLSASGAPSTQPVAPPSGGSSGGFRAPSTQPVAPPSGGSSGGFRAPKGVSERPAAKR